MKKIIIKDMADVCEEADRRTRIECEWYGIKVDKKIKKTQDNKMFHIDEIYTYEAQEVFNKHCNHLTEKYNI